MSPVLKMLKNALVELEQIECDRDDAQAEVKRLGAINKAQSAEIDELREQVSALEQELCRLRERAA